MNTSTQSIVILAYGTQPMSFFEAAGRIAGKDSVLDQDVARMAGASFAVGNPAELAALRQRLEAGSLARERDANPGLSEAATQWLAGGERGISSNTIYETLTGINAIGAFGKDHPYDPADFRRCQLLLEQVPELQPMFYRMAEVSPEWRSLVKAWPSIVNAMDDEAPGWRDGKTGRQAPKAYNLIKAAIGRGI